MTVVADQLIAGWRYGLLFRIQTNVTMVTLDSGHTGGYEWQVL